MVLKYVLGINSRRGGVIGVPCFVLLCDFKQHREESTTIGILCIAAMHGYYCHNYKSFYID